MIPLRDDIPSSTFPFITIALIAANTGVYVYQSSLGLAGSERLVYAAAAVPYNIAHRAFAIGPLSPLITLFTSLFVHAGFFHLAGNMLFLWIFGDNVEDSFGHFRFFVFYVVSGVIASLTHVMVDPSSTVPMVGASGAIAGVLGAYFFLFPRARISTLVVLIIFITVVKIPAFVFLGIWFAVQILSSGYGGGIAWYAHIGGFVAGLVMVVFFRPARRA